MCNPLTSVYVDVDVDVGMGVGGWVDCVRIPVSACRALPYYPCLSVCIAPGGGIAACDL